MILRTSQSWLLLITCAASLVGEADLNMVGGVLVVLADVLSTKVLRGLPLSYNVLRCSSLTRVAEYLSFLRLFIGPVPLLSLLFVL
jgi:hypothetical protein